jgi:hypothetical protein
VFGFRHSGRKPAPEPLGGHCVFKSRFATDVLVRRAAWPLKGRCCGRRFGGAMLRKKQEFLDRKIEDLQTRRARQSIEGVAAMAEYVQAQKSVLDRTARLRAQRLERERALRKISEKVS